MGVRRCSYFHHAPKVSSFELPRLISLRSDESPDHGAFFMSFNWRSYQTISLAPLWCIGGAVLLGLSWLLPNSTRPWTSFHSDAWAATALILIGFTVFFKRRQALTIHGLPVAIALISLIPPLQFLTGILPFAGYGWLPMLYLLGFSMAMLIGSTWDKWHPKLMQLMLFGAIVFAGVLSSVLQLYQWLGLTQDSWVTNIWVLQYNSTRPYANLGQPNQLATLLLWGLIGCAWLVFNRLISGKTVGLIAALLMSGLALTQSRSGLLSLVALCIAAVYWRKIWYSQALALGVILLIFWYVIQLLLLPHLGQYLFLDTQSSLSARSTNELRPAIWAMILDASTLRPLAGYGWNQVLPAQLAVTENHKEIIGLYTAQAHNLFLDLIIWTGWPIAIVIGSILIAWFVTAAKRVKNVNDAAYFLAVLVIGVHSMVEFPLHYGYFLFLTGFFIGALNGRMDIWCVARLHFVPIVIMFFLVTVGAGYVVYDYFRLEAAYNNLRFKQANFKNAPNIHIPHAIVINQFQIMLDLFALTPTGGLNSDELRRFEQTVTAIPSPHNLGKLITIMSLNDEPEKARFWFEKAKSLLGPADLKVLKSDLENYKDLSPHLGYFLE